MTRLLNGPLGRPMIQTDGGQCQHIVTSASPVAETDFDSTVVRTTGSQTVAGNKTFSEVVLTSQGVIDDGFGLVAGFFPSGAIQELSGAGAVNLTSYYTAVTNTGADALTLAAGTANGHLKKITMVADPGTDSTLTFTDGTGDNATIVFADVGDFCVLMWHALAWKVIELGNDADGATAPVYTVGS